jgi:hypothetical protein
MMPIPARQNQPTNPEHSLKAVLFKNKANRSLLGRRVLRTKVNRGVSSTVYRVSRVV